MPQSLKRPAPAGLENPQRPQPQPPLACEKDIEHPEEHPSNLAKDIEEAYLDEPFVEDESGGAGSRPSVWKKVIT